MQSNGLRASSLQKGFFAVSPGTTSVHYQNRQPCRRYFACACLIFLASVFSAGTAYGQTLSFNPTPGNFGSLAVGSSRTISVTIKNSGSSSVTISGDSVHATGFSLSGLSLPHTISAGGSTVVSLKFAPTSSGLHTGYISFTLNWSPSSAQYSVSGTGAGAGTIATTPSSVSFGSVANGATNSQTVQLKNTGGTSVTVSSASVSGAGFKLSGITIPLTLAAAQTKSFTVAFAPTTSGSVTGSVTIKSNATNPTHTIALSGTGASATRAISLSTSSLNFGNEVVGGTSTLGVAVKNTGNSSLTVSGISVTGTGFSVNSGVTGTTIAAGQTAEMNLVFAPKATGSVSGKASITSNATNSPSAVSLSGTGVSSSSHFVALNWTASSTSGVVGYHVYRSTTAGGSFARLTASLLTALKYTDGSVSGSKTYYYVVTAVSSNGAESSYSGQVTANVP